MARYYAQVGDTLVDRFGRESTITAHGALAGFTVSRPNLKPRIDYSRAMQQQMVPGRITVQQPSARDTAIATLKELASDADPQVRLEAAKALLAASKPPAPNMSGLKSGITYR